MVFLWIEGEGHHFEITLDSSFLSGYNLELKGKMSVVGNNLGFTK